QVSTNRKAILNWSNHFLPILLHEREKRNCKYVFTVLTKAHRQAYNAFVRPRSPKRKLPRYHLYRRFQMNSLHGLLPFGPKPLDTVSIRHAHDQDREGLCHFILKRTTKLSFHYSDSKETLLREFARLKDFKISDFLIALDSKKNVVGCVLPWSNQVYQDFIIHSYNGRALTLYQALRFFSFLGFTHKLPTPVAPLDFKYLTYFYFENPDIFQSLLSYAWTRLDKNQFLSFSHFKDDYTTRLPKSFIRSKIKCGLYCLLAPEDPIPEFLKLAQLGRPPEYEPFLI
ncbi:MAG: hypothetical protein KDD34_05230, partial [Bdellovibrionales bacterium]|nr:hypothetical protein [Bdellovibrionales bacterium]